MRQGNTARDFINLVQAEAVRTAIAGTAQTALAVLSITAHSNREAAIPAGPVSVRDVAGLYIFDNALVGIAMTGAQVKAHLEKLAEYFRQVTGIGPFTPDELTNAITDAAPTGTPDYNYDVMSGMDTQLPYYIDVARSVGSRVVDPAYTGVPIDLATQFVVAVNGYRQSGGGFPGVTRGRVVHNAQQEIRQLIIDWVTSHEVMDPPDRVSNGWKLVSNGALVLIRG